jgi:hypothetical protein
VTDLARTLKDIVETLEDNLDAPEWMIRDLIAKGRAALDAEVMAGVR